MQTMNQKQEEKKNTDGTLSQTKEQQEHTLNKFFRSVFRKKDINQIPIVEDRYQNDIF